MITIIGGGFAGLSAAYFLHRAGKDVTVLEWSRGLGGRAATRNVGYRTMDSGAQRLDLSPLSSNQLETDARALLHAVAEERGVLAHLQSFPNPVFRFDGRSISTAQQVEVPNWSYLDGGMKVLADALVKDIPVRTHTRISDIVFETDHYTLRNQRGETLRSDGIVIALPAPYALALLQPHAGSNKKVKKITDLLNEVNYEPMIGAIFGTTKINFKEPFSALFTDDVTAPIFWLSQEGTRRKLGVRRNENAFVLQLGAEISRDYVLKTDKETFAAIERVFEEVLDVALPDVVYGEIQRWPAAFLSSSPFTVDTVKPSDFKVPLYLAGDYIAGQSSIASAFWSGKAIADKMLKLDTFKFIAEPARAQAQLGEEEWKAVVPPARAPRKPRPKPLRRPGTKGKFDAKKGKRLPVGPSKEPVQRGKFKPRPSGGGDRRQPAYGQGPRTSSAPRGGGYGRQVGGPPRQGGGGPRQAGGPPRQGQGGYQNRGGGVGGPQQADRRQQGGGGYQGQQGGRGPRPAGGGGGYQRPGGYQQGGGYDQQRGGGRNEQRGTGGGYQQRGSGGGYQQRGPAGGGGGYQSGGGVYQPRGPGAGSGGGGGYRGRPQQGGGPQQRPPGGPRDYNQQPQTSGGGGAGRRPPSRGPVVYTTNPRPNPQQGGGGGYQPRGGYDPALRREEEERRNRARSRRPQRPLDDDNIGNR